MNKRVKALWLEALRSGKYVQGDGYLRAKNSDGDNLPDKFCCLGVLCEIAVAEGVIAKPKDPYETLTEEEQAYVEAAYRYARGADQFPPKTVVKWANLGESNPSVAYAVDEFDGEDLTDTLSSLNDEGKTFEEIADFIEASL